MMPMHPLAAIHVAFRLLDAFDLVFDFLIQLT
jgi:hypothetical protein